MKFHLISLTAVICFSTVAQSWGAPLTLQECLNKARENNPALKSALWDSRIAEENSRIAKVATYPRIDASVGYTMQLDAQAAKLGGITAETQDADFATAGIAATYTLYDFGRRDARIKRESAALEATSQTFLANASDVALQIIESYFKILEAERLIQAADEEVTQITEHRRVAQVLFDEGVVTRNDVLQAEVRLASAKQKRLTVANQRENGWALLNFLTGSDPAFRGELDSTAAVNGPAQSAPEGINQTNNRHDIKAQKQLFEAREFEVQENRENYIPEIFTRVAMDYMQNDKVREQTIYSAMIGIRLNLFDGFAADAAREKVVKQRSKQLDTVRLAEQHARLEITTARNDANIAKERIAVTEAAIKQSEENLRINKERYQERVGIASEVLDAETLVVQTKTDYFRALYDYQTALARLQNALGEL